MEGRMLSIMKQHSKRMVNVLGFQIPISISFANGTNKIDIFGLGVKHHISIDTDGNQYNTKNARATIDEDVLVANSYPVRNLKGEVDLIGHLVSFKDSSGELRHYRVRETFPDETLGLIVLTLGDFDLKIWP